MKARDLILQLLEFNPDAEVHFFDDETETLCNADLYEVSMLDNINTNYNEIEWQKLDYNTDLSDVKHILFVL